MILQIVLFIFIFLMLLLLFITKNKDKENFNNFSEMNNNNNLNRVFCKKLRLLDPKNEKIFLLQELSDDLKKKNDKVIKHLSDQILNLEHDIHNKELNKKIQYKLKSHDRAEKQIEIIDLAKKNIKNRNKKFLNVK